MDGIIIPGPRELCGPNKDHCSLIDRSSLIGEFTFGPPRQFLRRGSLVVINVVLGEARQAAPFKVVVYAY